jgi:hypothetical protein
MPVRTQPRSVKLSKGIPSGSKVFVALPAFLSFGDFEPLTKGLVMIFGDLGIDPYR